MATDSTDRPALAEALKQLRTEHRVVKYKLAKTQAKFEKHSRELRRLEAEIAKLMYHVSESGTPTLGAAWMSDLDPQPVNPAGRTEANRNGSG